jgi:hypothetical protein
MTQEGRRADPLARTGSSTFYFLRFYPLSACNADGGAGYCPPVHAVDLPMRLRA